MADDWGVGTEVVVKIMAEGTSDFPTGEEILLIPDGDVFRVEQSDGSVVALELADSDSPSADDTWRGTITTNDEHSVGITLLPGNAATSEAAAADGVL